MNEEENGENLGEGTEEENGKQKWKKTLQKKTR